VFRVDRTRSIVITASDILAQSGRDSQHGQRQQPCDCRRLGKADCSLR
jgi:hypothetical protein